MRSVSKVTLGLLCTVLLSCSKQTTQRGYVQETDQNIQILERIEQSGNRYRTASDLMKYGSSTLERSLADSHFQLTRSILELEFQLAEIESKYLALSEPPTSGTSQLHMNQSQYDKAAADVWRIYSE